LVLTRYSKNYSIMNVAVALCPDAENNKHRPIYLFPASMDDELHISQAGRYHVASGNLNTRHSFKDLYEKTPFRNTHCIPLHLERFAEKLPGLTRENVEMLLRGNTLFPLFEIFSDAMLLSSDSSIPIELQIRNMPKRIVGQSGKTHLCFECLKSDWAEYGERYIHRCHQIPGVEHCWKHGCRLLSCCPFCGCPFERKDLPDLILAPWERCICGQYLPEMSFWKPVSDGSDIELGYAKYTHDLLTCPSRHLGIDLLRDVYRRKASELGLVRKSRIDLRATQTALEEHLGDSFLSRLDSAYKKGCRNQWLRIGSIGGLQDTPLSRHLAVTYFLFGEASQFWKTVGDVVRERAESSASVSQAIVKIVREKNEPQGSHPIRYDSAKELHGQCSQEQKEINDVLSQRPEWKIEDLWREKPGLMRRLLRKGEGSIAWLNRRLSIEGCHGQTIKEVGLLCSDEDALWAEKFRVVAWNEYYSEKWPKKITSAFVMRQSGWKSVSKPDPRQYPQAREALDALAESQWHFYARRIIWVKLSTEVKSKADGMLTHSAGVEHHRGLDLLRLFSEVPKGISLAPESIMVTLKDFGIDKQWCGPPKQAKYKEQGRKYISRFGER
jgi:hypothetical protein